MSSGSIYEGAVDDVNETAIILKLNGKPRVCSISNIIGFEIIEDLKHSAPVKLTSADLKSILSGTKSNNIFDQDQPDKDSKPLSDTVPPVKDDSASQPEHVGQKNTISADAPNGYSNQTRINTAFIKANPVPKPLTQQFDGYNLDRLTKEWEKAKNNSTTTHTTYIAIGTQYQRLQDYISAEQVFSEGIKRYPWSKLAFLVSRVQLYEVTKSWQDASRDYENILEIGSDKPAREIHYSLAYSRVLVLQGKKEAALKLLHKVQKQYTNNATIQNAIVSIHSGQNQILTDTDGLETADVPIVELSDNPTKLISPMMLDDITQFDYRDETIISKGSPDWTDVLRLKEIADKATKEAAEYAERYPLYLEAAKAVSDIKSKLDHVQFEMIFLLLARYAVLKAGSIYQSMVREISDPSTILTKKEVQRMADSASSYYLEALYLQSTQVQALFMLTPLTYMLKSQLIANYIGDKNTTEFIIKGNLARILPFILQSDSTNDVDILSYVFATIGATSPSAWNKLSELKAGPSTAFRRLWVKKNRRILYGSFSRQIEKNLHTEKRPGEVLKEVFSARKNHNASVSEAFNKINVPMAPDRLTMINENMDKIQQYSSVLFSTDRDLLEKMRKILDLYAPYDKRTSEEQVRILSTARDQIDNLAQSIKDDPTYWGKTIIASILETWTKGIKEQEKYRIKDLYPKLAFEIEPQIFRRESNVGSFSVKVVNQGKATAQSYNLRIELFETNREHPIEQIDISNQDELAPGKSCYHDITFASDDLSEKSLHVIVNHQFCYEGLSHSDNDEFQITLAYEDAYHFTEDGILWDDVNVPQQMMFKGRSKLIENLKRHILSINRNKSVILYGLTRMGKTSVLKYLGDNIRDIEFKKDAEIYRIRPFYWHFENIAAQSSAQDIWESLIKNSVLDILYADDDKGKYDEIFHTMKYQQSHTYKFKDLDIMMQLLAKKMIYPVFLIDEFSQYKKLIAKSKLDSSFLSNLRQYSIKGLASFIFAGTFDIESMIDDPTYGFEGQMVNTVSEKISKIDEVAAREIITALQGKIDFTPDAINYVMELSNNIPYFIQMICRNCSYYALNKKLRYIGVPEINRTLDILTGKAKNESVPGIYRITEERFKDNMLFSLNPTIDSEADTSDGRLGVKTLLITIAHQKEEYVSHAKMVEIWGNHQIPHMHQIIADSLDALERREIVIRKQIEESDYYKLAVRFFRVWLIINYPNLSLCLDRLKR